MALGSQQAGGQHCLGGDAYSIQLGQLSQHSQLMFVLG